VRAAPPGRPTAVLLGDLPALRPADLSAGLRATARTLAARPQAPMAAVPDAEGSGTVLLAARTAAALDPAFGPSSLAEHRRRGAAVVELDDDRLRHDVDTPADLRVALALGVGPRTASQLAAERSAS
jgi:2-phospho-L-lactate guanylyltransferase